MTDRERQGDREIERETETHRQRETEKYSGILNEKHVIFVNMKPLSSEKSS